MEINFGQIIGQAARDAGVELKAAAADVNVYANNRVLHLESIAGQPGFDEAVKAEAEAVVIYAACRTVDLAEASDARVWGVVFGLLSAAVAA